MHLLRLFLLIGFAAVKLLTFGREIGSDLPSRLRQDQQSMARCDAGLAEVIRFVRAHPRLFTEVRNDLLTTEEKREIGNAWKRFLEYELALGQIAQSHRDYYKLTGEAEVQTFFAGYAASLTQYRHALEFLDLTAPNSTLDKLLDEPVPEIGLKANAYSKFRFQFLNTGRGIEFGARELVFASYSRKHVAPSAERLKEHAARIWEMGKGRGQAMTFANATKVVRRAGFNLWLPIQTGVSEWMGDTRVHRMNRSLITKDQIAALKLEPGDILLERREWYLSNIGLPGFWPHAALYIGTAAERTNFFNDLAVKEWVRQQGESSGNFQNLLHKSYPEASEQASRGEHGHSYRVLEAVSEGVTFTTLEHSADADSLAVLRPRLGKKEKAAGIFRAFRYFGRPYDFNFDFDTDASLVCTELVCKAYETNSAGRGLQFPIDTMLGRKVTPANLMVRQFDQEFGTPEQQTDLVCFLDGNERTGRSPRADVDTFRQSWRRPKWHILFQSR